MELAPFLPAGRVTWKHSVYPSYEIYDFRGWSDRRPTAARDSKKGYLSGPGPHIFILFFGALRATPFPKRRWGERLILLRSQGNQGASPILKPGPYHNSCKDLAYEWDLFLKVGEMGPEEASKLLVQTEMYVSKYTCKGRAPEFHY